MTITVDVGPELRQIMSRLLDDAQSRPERWAQLTELLDDLPPDVHEAVMNALRTVDTAAWDDAEKSLVRLRMQSLAVHHLEHLDAPWALPESVAREILTVSSRFEPADPIAKVAWLFSSSPDIPGAATGDWRAEQEVAMRLRAEAVSSLLPSNDLDRVIELAERSEAPWTVGVALADVDADLDGVALLAQAHAVESTVLFNMARAFLLRMADRRDRGYLVALLDDERAETWPSAVRAEVLICMPFDQETWRLVGDATEGVRREYWQRVPVTGRGGLDAATIQFLVPQFNAHGALTSSLAVMALYSEAANPQLVLETLELAASRAYIDSVRWHTLTHDIGTLFELLQNADIDDDRLGILEWQLLPFSRWGHQSPRALHRRLSRDPAFFVEVLSLVYRGVGDPRETAPSEADRARTVRAYELLSSWRTPPGIVDAGMDTTALLAWTVGVQELAQSAGRRNIAEEQLGEVLAYAPVGSDEIWPHEAVRELLEDRKSESMERGLEVGVFNSRGVTTRHPEAGGDLERQLADRYAGYAAKLHRWPRTAAALNGIADGYRRHGRREDAQAALR